MAAVRPSHFVLLAGIFVAMLGPLARGQYHVDNQVGQVDSRVGGELYGHNAPSRYAVPQQFRLLPSEVRYARWRSGALPSEIAMNRAAVGPLAPNGELDYIPEQSALQRAMNLPAPRLYNPAYDWRLGQARQAAYSYAARSGYPRNAREGVAATTYKPGALASAQNRRPAQADQALRPGQLGPIPLQGAPDRPLPTGQLYDDVKNVPNATPGAEFLSRTPAGRRSEKVDSLGDPKK